MVSIPLTMVAIDYVVVQAGGKGTRLGKYTRNRPKALVPVGNTPIIFYLFRKFPNAKFVIIGDYMEDVLRNYLNAFRDKFGNDFIFVSAEGSKGTCAGVSRALSFLPEGARFMLTWCDLILDEGMDIPYSDGNLVGLSDKFECRWSFKDGVASEASSSDSGIAGVFVFKDKSVLSGIPTSGEFVRWLAGSGIPLEPFYIGNSQEFGLIDRIPEMEIGKCRPFNSIEDRGDILVKKGIDSQGKKLAVREVAWYRHVSKFDHVPIPKIYKYEPELHIEKVNGRNVYAYNFTYEERKETLKKLVSSLKYLHECDRIPADAFSSKKAYFTKTMDRLAAVRDLIPHANERYITVNGKKCRNVYFHLIDLEKKLYDVRCNEFKLIHGDCTFSNIMLRDGKDPVFIDPRGYFGSTEIFGDPAYDWAKLYYSIKGNYDMFNLRRFDIQIGEEVRLEIQSNGWEDMEDEFFALLSEDGVSANDIKLLHAVIWLSLTTYAWEDYDSICGAFYNGIWYLEDVL